MTSVFLDIQPEVSKCAAESIRREFPKALVRSPCDSGESADYFRNVFGWL